MARLLVYGLAQNDPIVERSKDNASSTVKKKRRKWNNNICYILLLSNIYATIPYDTFVLYTYTIYKRITISYVFLLESTLSLSLTFGVTLWPAAVMRDLNSAMASGSWGLILTSITELYSYHYYLVQVP